MNHLDALQLRLSNERCRLAAATSPKEIAQRKVWVAQIEKEIAGEIEFLGQEMSDAELLAELGI